MTVQRRWKACSRVSVSLQPTKRGTGRSLFEGRKAREVEACSGAVISLVLFASVWPFRRCRAWGWVTVLVGSLLHTLVLEMLQLENSEMPFWLA